MFRSSIFLFFLLFDSAAHAAEEKVDFNRDVRPILSDKCFFCHGPDEKTQEADLRLDLREGATRDLGGYAAIVPGDPAKSELIFRLETHDEDEVMPPPKAKRGAVTEAEIGTLKRWISQGAEYQGHWAFEPLSKDPPPAAAGTDIPNWPRNAIDQFVLARLEKDKVKPSSEAKREVLIRRLYLDLIGLLPTPEQVAAFTRDPSPDAYERLVDSLLTNPHYGERWGRHWLDQARYADSNGYSVDSYRAMWPYRDWVINALNTDMPFDQFTIEQLAGDLLPNPSKSQIAATAFHRNTLINQEGGSDPEQFRVEAVIDRANTTGAVWLGLTVGCAQCHTHKFDPIPQTEYYQLTAFFNSGEDRNNTGPTIDIAPGEMFPKNPHAPASAPPAPASGAPAWQAATYTEFKTAAGAKVEKLEDNSLLFPETKPHDTYLITSTTDLETVAAIRLRILTHESLPKNGPGKASNGNIVLTDVKAFVDGKEVGIANAIADHSQPGYPATDAIDRDPKSGWAINVAGGSKAKMNAPHEAAFILTGPQSVSGKPIEVRLYHALHPDYLIGRLALDFSATAPPAPVAPPKAKAGPAKLMVMRDLNAPRPTFLLTRGDFTRPDKERGELKPGVLSAVPPALTEPKDRLDLARWLVDPANPLTSRVAVNRVWMHYFGRGLVETDQDFGTQGSPPSHPALLDHLATYLIENGWSLKKLHRHIVTSATFRQSSNARPDLDEIDPKNYLLARQSRVRLDAEIIRDAALAASGLLNDEIGGPPVTPPQPAGVYAFTQSSKTWKDAQGPDRYRRALYTTFYRSAPYPLFTTFDAPDFQTTCTSRPRSNTPLQALNIANDPTFLEFASALATRVAQEIPGEESDVLEQRIARIFHLTLSRHPNPKELSILTKYAREQSTAASRDPKSATALLAVARALLNTDNFITRE